MPSHMDAAGGFQTGREVEWRPRRQRTQVHWCDMQGAKLTATAEVWTRLSFKVVHTLSRLLLSVDFFVTLAASPSAGKVENTTTCTNLVSAPQR
jgi:hypothetical protein